MPREFSDSSPEAQQVILIDTTRLRMARHLIDGCEQCHPEDAEIPLDSILDRLTGADPSGLHPCGAFAMPALWAAGFGEDHGGACGRLRVASAFRLAGARSPRSVACSKFWKPNRGRCKLPGVSQYVIDRIENGWAVLEDENATVFNVPAGWLPLEAKEGDVVRTSLEEPAAESRTVRFSLDPAARQDQQKKARELRDNLPRGPEGDVSL